MPTIGTNPSAQNAIYFLGVADFNLQKATRRLSSGSKISDPSDDAAGVAVSGKLDASIRRLSAASESVQNLISFAQVADSFLHEIQDQLTRMSELATRATNAAFSASDRGNYMTEFAKLQSNITNQITNAKFNNTRVFDTSQTISTSVSQDGINIYTITMADANGSVSNITAAEISTTSGASAAIANLSTALERIASSRANVNADIAALNFYIQNLDPERVRTSEANSRIKDLDFADESTQFAKYSVLSQAGYSMLAQANSTQATVLGLLR